MKYVPVGSTYDGVCYSSPLKNLPAKQQAISGCSKDRERVNVAFMRPAMCTQRGSCAVVVGVEQA